MSKGKSILLRNVPDATVKAIDKYAAENTGPGGKPSRGATILHLIDWGLQRAIVRGDAATGTKRGE